MGAAVVHLDEANISGLWMLHRSVADQKLKSLVEGRNLMKAVKLGGVSREGELPTQSCSRRSERSAISQPRALLQMLRFAQHDIRGPACLTFSRNTKRPNY